jgi:hypothetical protein
VLLGPGQGVIGGTNGQPKFLFGHCLFCHPMASCPVVSKTNIFLTARYKKRNEHSEIEVFYAEHIK